MKSGLLKKIRKLEKLYERRPSRIGLGPLSSLPERCTSVDEAIANLPRSHFLDPVFSRSIDRHASLPIGHGQTISQVETVRLMSEAALLTGQETVLEIGTGSGYQAAVLSRLCSRVFTIERIPELGIQARQRLESLEIENVICRLGDGTLGWTEEAPFDVILVTAAFKQIPKPLLNQLVYPNGRLVMPVGIASSQQLVRCERHTQKDFVYTTLSPCQFVPLVGRFGYKRHEIA